MKWEYEFVDDGPFDVIVKTTGVATTAEQFIEERRRMYADPRFRSGANILVDHTEIEGDLASEEMREIAETGSYDFEKYQTAYMAHVSRRDLHYGLIRLAQAYTSGPARERLRVFKTVEEAYEWIEEIKRDG